ncbi:hypothetical protein [Mobilicoccus caccae]|uniref:Uncharacterized protein n=1 Tax=Mobilicoccus caccae TaxID=1859295 RepID=A0ABQ6IU04_9MICO|nr:hypothetical protein [Mobilicoccus caccae]GMA40199.1 hypothetical protein GCM10025883_22440 [Mobilicoccus caccae]
MNRRRGPWWVHCYPVGDHGRWLVLRGVRGPLLARYGVPATYCAARRGVVVLARRRSDVEAVLEAVGARLVMHQSVPNATVAQVVPTPEAMQLELLGGAA